MRPTLKIIGISIIGALISTVLLLLFGSISVLDPFLPLQKLFERKNIEMTGEPTGLGFWFNLWSYVVFSHVALVWIISDFKPMYVILLVSNLLGIASIGIISKTKTHALLSFVGFYICNFLIAITGALLLPQSLNVGALPPEQQEFTLGMSSNLVQLTWLIPFYLLVYFTFNLVLGIVVVAITNNMTSKN